MKKENLIRGIGEIDDRIIERYHDIEARLAQRLTKRAKTVRIIAIAACLAILICACVPVGFMAATPIGQAVLHGDSEVLTEQLEKIEGFVAWQDRTAQKLEQILPPAVFEQMQDIPVVNVLTTSQFSGLSAQETFAKETPYNLYFDSNGDGTCTLRYMTVDPANIANFVLEVPETSPEGDTVTAIDIGQGTRIKQSTHADFPYVLTPATMSALIATAKANGLSDFDCNKLQAYYLKMSVNGLDEVEYSEMVGAFPIVVYGDLYVFDGGATVQETERVYAYLTEYCEWDQQKYADNISEILQLAKQSGNRERAELCLTVLRNVDMRTVKGITIPNTVTSISGLTWRSLSDLESITVAEDNPTLKMVDGCLVDVETGTLMLYLRDDGLFPEELEIRTLGAYAFALCKLANTEEGQELALYVPEGVTRIEQNCLAKISLENAYTLHVYLPLSLDTLGRQSEYCELIYHYPGTLAELESNITFVGMLKKDRILLVTADSEQVIQYTFDK